MSATATLSAGTEVPLWVLQYLHGRLERTSVKDKGYLSTQLGPSVADYLSWKKNEDGRSDQTISSYERDLAALCHLRPTVGPDDITIDDLRAVRDTFSDGQKHRVTAAFRDCFRWLYEEGRTSSNPAGRLRYQRRKPAALTDLFTDEEKGRILAAQTTIRDRACVLLLMRAGVRKGELRQMRARDVNLLERYVLVSRGKGGKFRRVPIRGVILDQLNLLLLENVPGLDRPLKPEEFLLYPEDPGNERRVKRAYPDRMMAQSTAHRWWYRCLQKAGVVDPKVNRGRRMHTTRHTYATDLGRASGWNFLAVQKNLGHSRISTTLDIYTQFAFEDQELAVELLPDIQTEG